MNSSSLIIPLMLAAMAVFMFLSIRNQKKRANAAAQMQQSVVSGSRVQLHSGLFGTVVDASDDEVVTIEVAPGVVTEWNRLAIRETISADASSDSAEEVPDSPAALDDRADGGDADEKPEEK
ncbi:preprotein translocase subunit YajC [Gordonia zhaorongruii]|uniref:preprotein translocase subunit YajC n=1 Tax=Gordonia zhaorongruii TaxID=2597659 RepID=UPI001052E319|nr:preprotein translocase subunit YajC [Gordonia zhaorongruii]